MTRMILMIASVLLFTTLTSLAIYAIVHATQLSLPTPLLSRILSIILPIANVFALGPYVLQRKPTLPLSVTFWVLASLETVLITLSAADLRPQSLSCYLTQRWQYLYTLKDARSIRSIQDSLDCCGLRTTSHQAYPFYNRREGTLANACAVSTGRHSACQDGWAREERIVLGLMLGIAVCGLVAKLLLLLLARWRPEWVRRENVGTLRLGDHHGRVEEEEQPRAGGRYLDNPVIDEEHLEQGARTAAGSIRGRR